MPMSLWGELRRRNVFRVGAAYLVAAWLVVQVASIVLPSFDVPPWVMRAIIFVSALGLPVALVLAWLYEWTPQGIRAETDLPTSEAIRFTGRKIDFFIIGLLAVAVLFLFFDEYLYHDEIDVAKLDSIAVLPFENLSTNPEDEYIAGGLADEILSTLGRVKELRVASRLASQYFKGKDTNVATIAETLQVDYVLSGGLRRSGDRIRVTAALDDPSSGHLVWSDTFDRDLSDVLDIQRSIAGSVATAIVPVLSERSKRQLTAPPTSSADAYDFYLRGRDYLRQPEEETTLGSAIQLFNRAIDLDPSFAHAYAGLCDAHLANYYLARSAQSVEDAKVACTRALALDDSLWEVHVALGNLHRELGEYRDAVREYETAVAQQPSAAAPYLALAQTYSAQDLEAEAEAMFRRAEDMESGYWKVHNEFGNFLWKFNRVEDAIPHYQRVIDLTPDSGIGYDNLGVSYQALGEFDEAERTWNASPLPSRWTYSNRGLNYYYLGDFGKSVDDLLKSIELAPEWYVPWGQLGDSYRHIPGDEENAARAYAKAIELAERDLRINPSDRQPLARLTMYYAYSGQLDRAAARLEDLFGVTSDDAPDGIAYYFAALTSLELRETDRAYDYLARAVEAGVLLREISANPDLAPLRGTPRYEAIMSGQRQ
jgi:TolB-like protein/tetratricopeptide (TPR) repeat protein